jgi:hypothetical protein
MKMPIWISGTSGSVCGLLFTPILFIALGHEAWTQPGFPEGGQRESTLAPPTGSGMVTTEAASARTTVKPIASMTVSEAGTTGTVDSLTVAKIERDNAARARNMARQENVRRAARVAGAARPAGVIAIASAGSSATVPLAEPTQGALQER